MKLRSVTTSAGQTTADALVLGVFSDQPLSGAAAEIDRLADGLLSRLVESGEISTKLMDVTPVLGAGGSQAGQILIVGLGELRQFDQGDSFRAAGAAARKLASKPRGTVAFFLADDLDDARIESAVAGALAGCQGQDLYRETPKTYPFEETLWGGASDEAVERGRAVGESLNFVRQLVNAPACDIYPDSFAQQAEKLSSIEGVEVEVWDKAKLEAERCAAILAVSQGSSREPRIVIVRYQGAGKDAPTLALVGKGVTFDSGGLSLKPSEGMLTMKRDMAGAATVVGAIRAIAELKLPVNVTGVVGLTENMTGPAAYKLGDVIRARSGRTIEIHNTDAEGRVVLADTLNVALDEKPAKMVDLATLTGAVMVALGEEVAGLMTNDQAWCDTVQAAADRAGEQVWQLPMFEQYRKKIESHVADIKNTGGTRMGGAITAAKFLECFVGDTPWTHIDIAGPSFFRESKSWTDGGATGVMMRSLVELARAWK